MLTILAALVLSGGTCEITVQPWDDHVRPTVFTFEDGAVQAHFGQWARKAEPGELPASFIVPDSIETITWDGKVFHVVDCRVTDYVPAVTTWGTMRDSIAGRRVTSPSTTVVTTTAPPPTSTTFVTTPEPTTTTEPTTELTTTTTSGAISRGEEKPPETTAVTLPATGPVNGSRLRDAVIVLLSLGCAILATSRRLTRWLSKR